MGLVCITCGPASAPIDKVRRITNFATGEIGSILSDRISQAGFDVVCFRGEGATAPLGAGEVRLFTTNESLEAGLKALSIAPVAILHAAALCDFEVASVDGGSGGKIESRGGDVHLVLRPAKKLLPRLREWFPEALLVGWKYEVDGTRTEVLAKAMRQFAEAHTDRCVVNGPAFGEGFGLLDPLGSLEPFPDKAALAGRLVRLIEERAQPSA